MRLEPVTTNQLVAAGLMLFLGYLAVLITRDAWQEPRGRRRVHLWLTAGVLWVAAGGCGWAVGSEFLQKI